MCSNANLKNIDYFSADQMDRVDNNIATSLADGEQMTIKSVDRIPHDMGHPSKLRISAFPRLRYSSKRNTVTHHLPCVFMFFCCLSAYSPTHHSPRKAGLLTRLCAFLLHFSQRLYSREATFSGRPVDPYECVHSS